MNFSTVEHSTSQSPFSDPISFEASTRCKLFFLFFPFFHDLQLANQHVRSCISHRHVYKHVYNRLANYELETHLSAAWKYPSSGSLLPRRRPGQNEHPRFRISDVFFFFFFQKLFSSREKVSSTRNDDTTRRGLYIFQIFQILFRRGVRVLGKYLDVYLLLIWEKFDD